jgi:hypothetical protein
MGQGYRDRSNGHDGLYCECSDCKRLDSYENMESAAQKRDFDEGMNNYRAGGLQKVRTTSFTYIDGVCTDNSGIIEVPYFQSVTKFNIVEDLINNITNLRKLQTQVLKSILQQEDSLRQVQDLESILSK